MKRILLAMGVAGALLWLGSVGHVAAQGKKLKGDIKADGSSTTYLITEAVVSQFKKLYPGVNCSIGVAGTGGGIRKFIAGELDICNASRKIKDSEADAAKKAGIDFIELQVAWDGLAVVSNKKNTFANKLTMEQLKKIWHPDIDTFKNAKTWKDVSPTFPAEPLKLYGAGKDSGTFDYFTEAVNKKERLIRQDYDGSEDDNQTVTGVVKNAGGMGFFGVAYYQANKENLSVVALAAKADGPYYEPTEANVLSGKYPISRPLFIYVKKDSLKRPEMREFVEFYLRNHKLVKSAGYVPMSADQRDVVRDHFEASLKK